MIILIILLAAFSRLALSQFDIHPGIISPIMGMTIFAGCYFKKWWGFSLTIGALLISDYFLGLYDWKLMVSVYGATLIAYGIGFLLKRYLKWYNIISATLGASILFFLITNLAVWQFTNWYPHTQAGLTLCFTIAIPYFLKSLINNFVFTGAFFGWYALSRARREVPVCA